MYLANASDGSNLVRVRTCHVADEMHNELAAGDVKVELFERR